jgi:formylglycine-generating enzyme required for sulfatase activity
MHISCSNQECCGTVTINEEQLAYCGMSFVAFPLLCAALGQGSNWSDLLRNYNDTREWAGELLKAKLYIKKSNPSGSIFYCDTCNKSISQKYIFKQIEKNISGSLNVDLYQFKKVVEQVLSDEGDLIENSINSLLEHIQYPHQHQEFLEPTTIKHRNSYSYSKPHDKSQSSVKLILKATVILAFILISTFLTNNIIIQGWLSDNGCEPIPNKIKCIGDIAFVKISGGDVKLLPYKWEHKRTVPPTFSTTKVKEYYISKAEITVGQYRKCVNAGDCYASSAFSPGGCNWADWWKWWAHEDHPMNCVTWGDANNFAKWIGGSLPTEAQWKKALSTNQKFPWGNDVPSCKYTVMAKKYEVGDELLLGYFQNLDNVLIDYYDGSDKRIGGCGKAGTWRGCSKDLDVTNGKVCDMYGNVSEWILDKKKNDGYSFSASDKAEKRGVCGEHFNSHSNKSLFKSSCFGYTYYKESTTLGFRVVILP